MNDILSLIHAPWLTEKSIQAWLSAVSTRISRFRLTTTLLDFQPVSSMNQRGERGIFFFADILSYDFVACNKISKEIRVSNERGIEIVTFFLVEYIYIYISLIKSFESIL